jgi:hypothetical protein
MKNYKVKAIVNFPDKTTHQRRTLGEEFICTEERYNELKFKNVIELVEIIEETDEIDTNMIKLIAKPIETIKFVEKVVEEPTEEIVEKKPKKRRTTKKEN